jgi:hypothetical protein
MFPKTRRYFKLKKSLLQVLFHIQIILQKSSYYRHSSCQNQLSEIFDLQIMANEETNDETFDAALEETFEMVMKEPTKETIEETKETIHETCEEITAKAPVRLKFVSQRPMTHSWLIINRITILADVYYRFRHPVFTLIEYLGVVVNIIHIDSATLHLNVSSSHAFKKFRHCFLTTLSRSWSSTTRISRGSTALVSAN